MRMCNSYSGFYKPLCCFLRLYARLTIEVLGVFDGYRALDNREEL